MGGAYIDVADVAMLCVLSGVTLLVMLVPPSRLMPPHFDQAGPLTACWRSGPDATCLQLHWPQTSAETHTISWRHAEPTTLHQLARLGAWHRSGGTVSLVLYDSVTALPSPGQLRSAQQAERVLHQGAHCVEPYLDCAALHPILDAPALRTPAWSSPRSLTAFGI